MANSLPIRNSGGQAVPPLGKDRSVSPATHPNAIPYLGFYLWLTGSLLVLAWFGFVVSASDGNSAKKLLLPGETTHGHYQIELACSACHTPLNGVRQDACLSCHEEELANDTHSAKKFKDPTNADRLAILDATSCLTCHREHVPDRTHALGLSFPSDFCFHCHQDIAEQRPSHRALAYDSCTNAACHNYHDNSALYENFLLDHYAEADVLENPVIPPKPRTSRSMHSPLSIDDADAPDRFPPTAKVLSDWQNTAHAQAAVNCRECHQQVDGVRWTFDLNDNNCARCHPREIAGFTSGKHGMRIGQDLPPMKPGEARLPMKSAAHHRELSCTSCHADHAFDTQLAAVESCLRCHDDEHSLAYKSSRHYELWRNEVAGKTPQGGGVSCATCHMPRVHDNNGEFLVQHNQNDNLRPNEKMVRSVCAHCHGLEFSLSSLADEQVIRSGFSESPSARIKTLEMAKEWFETKRSERGESQK